MHKLQGNSLSAVAFKVHKTTRLQHLLARATAFLIRRGGYKSKWKTAGCSSISDGHYRAVLQQRTEKCPQQLSITNTLQKFLEELFV